LFLLARFFIGGRNMLQKREQLPLWYDGAREGKRVDV